MHGWLADCHRELKDDEQAAAAEPLYREALEMFRKLLGPEHPAVATSLNNLAFLLVRKGDYAAAEPLLREAVAISRGFAESYIYGTNLAWLYADRQRYAEAEPLLREAIAQIERLRAQAKGYTAEERGQLFTQLKRYGSYELMIEVQVGLGNLDAALEYLERSLGRAALDLLESGRLNLVEEAREAARQRNDLAEVVRIDAADRAYREAYERYNAIDHEINWLRGQSGPEVKQKIDARLADLRVAAGEVSEALQRRAALIRDAVPLADPRPAATLRAQLGVDERLLYFVVGEARTGLMLVRPGDVKYASLRWADGGAVTHATLAEAVERYRGGLVLEGRWRQRAAVQARMRGERGASEAGAGRSESEPLQTARNELDQYLRASLGDVFDERAADAVRERLTDGPALFGALIPPDVWAELKACRRVFVVPHGPLHRLPLESLVVEDGPDAASRRYWLDGGPELVYVSSGSLLYWARGQREEQRRAPRPPLTAALLGGAIYERSRNYAATDRALFRLGSHCRTSAGPRKPRGRLGLS